MKSCTRTAKIQPTLLTKDDLIGLVEIVKKSVPASDRAEDFKISTNLEKINISETSIETFLAHHDLPEKITRLSISAIGWNNDINIDKNVRMTFYDNYINLNIDGSDETWVLGINAQLTNFLKGKKSKLWFLNKIFPFISGVLPIEFLYFFASSIKDGAIGYSISAGILFVTTTILVALFFKGTFLPYTQIYTKEKRRILTAQNITIALAILSLIATILMPILVRN